MLDIIKKIYLPLGKVIKIEKNNFIIKNGFKKISLNLREYEAWGNINEFKNKEIIKKLEEKKIIISEEEITKKKYLTGIFIYKNYDCDFEKKKYFELINKIGNGKSLEELKIKNGEGIKILIEAQNKEIINIEFYDDIVESDEY